MVDVIHHAVYACAAGLVYEAMKKAEYEAEMPAYKKLYYSLKDNLQDEIFKKKVQNVKSKIPVFK